MPRMLIVTAFLLTLAASAEDSPLVAAAKRSKRNGPSKSVVITNATLVKTGGHITTTKKQEPLPKLQQPATTTNKPAKTAAASAPKPAKPPMDDAELESLEGMTNEDTSCPTCLPMLKPSATMPLQKVEFSNNQPNEVPRKALPAVAPAAPKDH